MELALGVGLWPFLLEVGVGPFRLGLALPFCSFFFFSFFIVSSIFDARGTISTTSTKDDGRFSTPQKERNGKARTWPQGGGGKATKGKDREGQDLAKRGGGEGHKRKGLGRTGPAKKKREGPGPIQKERKGRARPSPKEAKGKTYNYNYNYNYKFFKNLELSDDPCLVIIKNINVHIK